MSRVLLFASAVGLVAASAGVAWTLMDEGAGSDSSYDLAWLGHAVGYADAVVRTDELPQITHRAHEDSTGEAITRIDFEVDAVLYGSGAGPSLAPGDRLCAQYPDWESELVFPAGATSAVLVLDTPPGPDPGPRICPWTAEMVTAFTAEGDLAPVTTEDGWYGVAEQWAAMFPGAGEDDLALLLDWIAELDHTPEGAELQRRYEAVLEQLEGPPPPSWSDYPADRRGFEPYDTPPEVTARLVTVAAFIEIDPEAAIDGWLLEVRSSLAVGHAADMTVGTHPAHIMGLPGEPMQVVLVREEMTDTGGPRPGVPLAEFTMPPAETDIATSDALYLGPIGHDAIEAADRGEPHPVATRWITRDEFDALLMAGAEDGES